MTHSTPQMLVSGVPYTVVDVQGREPAALTDFVGHTTFHVQGPTGRHEVHGDGAEHDGVVRFHEKDHDGHGKDVRVWTVAPSPAGGFIAEAA